MNLVKTDFEWAAQEGLLSAEKAEDLWAAFLARHPEEKSFGLARVAYYCGALIVMSAMGWFMTLGWERYGGGGIALISVIYAVCFVLAGRTLWYKENLKIPGGLLFTLAVWMTPLAVYGIERMLGWWPQSDPGTFRDFHVWIRGSWILMELATILAGLIALRLVRFPFLTFPIAFSLWYMSMDLTPLLVGRRYFDWNQRLWVSAVFGAIVLIAAYIVDRRTEEDYAFWLYLFGLMAFWCGLSLMNSHSEAGKFAYCMVNVGLILLSLLLGRKAFIVFGSLGVFGYLSHLSWTVFKDSMMFPFVLTLIGIFVIFLGVKYQRNEKKITESVMRIIPPGLKPLLPMERGSR